MDINTLRSIATVAMFVAFIGIVVWAWSRKNKAAFDEAAQLPFQNDDANRENNG
ncbi:MAG: cbb3-type cytochrome c oxidase subunit 3 [Ignavibacteriae bacterium]|jgi:cytochrome c oxidase cbb3-type subunit 4|nr:MAG: cbb3-type cytochrome c oxidase subunit 3 [Ignavibacteriota bacterium]